MLLIAFGLSVIVVRNERVQTVRSIWKAEGSWISSVLSIKAISSVIQGLFWRTTNLLRLESYERIGFSRSIRVRIREGRIGVTVSSSLRAIGVHRLLISTLVSGQIHITRRITLSICLRGALGIVTPIGPRKFV